MRTLFIGLLLLVGCHRDHNPMIALEHNELRCGRCRRVIYDGTFAVYRNGYKEPINRVDFCKPDDPECRRLQELRR